MQQLQIEHNRYRDDIDVAVLAAITMMDSLRNTELRSAAGTA
jgi:hypothetical protein